MSRALTEWQVRFYEQAKQRGLLAGMPATREDTPEFRVFLERLLAHAMSELGEGFNDVRDGRLEPHFVMDERDECKPIGLPDALADCFGCLCYIAGVCGVDLDAAAVEAYAYGQKRAARSWQEGAGGRGS